MEFTSFIEKYNLPCDDVSTHKLYVSYLNAGKALSVSEAATKKSSEEKRNEVPFAATKPNQSNNPFSKNMNLNIF